MYIFIPLYWLLTEMFHQRSVPKQRLRLRCLLRTEEDPVIENFLRGPSLARNARL